MARPKTDFRNELKTRVRDATFEGVQQYMRENRCASEPPQLCDSSHEIAQSGTKTKA